ncbi:MAG: hypothetical protein K0U29_08830 [Gammaproteobacteria bacterium]|nr:hypothetical protein [Gammaproteobacteria bacterium]MCH9745017.1 hypothetical protein [Gammaproteobacteria bacterium]
MAPPIQSQGGDAAASLNSETVKWAANFMTGVVNFFIGGGLLANLSNPSDANTTLTNATSGVAFLFGCTINVAYAFRSRDEQDKEGDEEKALIPKAAEAEAEGSDMQLKLRVAQAAVLAIALGWLMYDEIEQQNNHPSLAVLAIIGVNFGLTELFAASDSIYRYVNKIKMWSSADEGGDHEADCSDGASARGIAAAMGSGGARQPGVA